MKLYSSNKSYKLYCGNSLDMLEVIEPKSIDAIITDPPYELNFMGKSWDKSGIAFNTKIWKKCFEVLKPGAYLLAFGGTRTFHRIACAIEDAGFEIRDTIMWLYGSGFPKSMDISKAIDKREGQERIVLGKRTDGRYAYNFQDGNNQFTNAENNKKTKCNEKIGLITVPATILAKQWQGWGTALKPAYEPIIIARKPIENSVVENVLKYGVGGINIDECRVGNEEISYFPTNLEEAHGNKFGNGAYMPKDTTKSPITHTGRFPSNVILTYDETDFDEVCGGMPDTTSGNRHNTAARVSEKNSGYGFDLNTRNEYNDEGNASRYFYCAKASKKDRDEGLKHFNKEIVNDGRNTPIDNAYQRGNTLRKNIHPTVKPIELMQYLVRLVSPKGAIILDLFNGSGSTGKAVMYENRERDANYKYIGIELTEEYLPISKARMDEAITQELEKEIVLNEKETAKQQDIFDFLGDK